MQEISGTVFSTAGLVSGNVKMTEKVSAEQLVFAERSEFPESGMEDRLYVAVDENASYRFDAGQNAYVRLDSFDAIQSRLREE